MAKRLTFKEFENLLLLPLASSEVVSEYIELDERSAVPHLVFRSDALTDLPPEDYDLDERIYQYERAQSRREHELEDAIEIFSKIKIVAEGGRN